MPLLAQEIDIYPDDLLDREVCDTDIKWWAVYTRSRQEKELMRRLYAWEIPFYCPVAPHRSQSPSGRIRTSFVPLFTNYVFMQCDGHDRYRALQTNLISYTQEVSDGIELANDLRQVQRMIQLGRPIQLTNRLPVGSRVRVKRGPLAGLAGVVVQTQGESHLIVAVNFLQQGASIKLKDLEVEAIG